ncbi:hypothetical protein INR49_011515, partial [Caranx melampygus]
MHLSSWVSLLLFVPRVKKRMFETKNVNMNFYYRTLNATCPLHQLFHIMIQSQARFQCYQFFSLGNVKDFILKETEMKCKSIVA